ncbi:MAG: sigma-70 family RNA polymerase sigma factor [Gammaproteobacteria bacterium]
MTQTHEQDEARWAEWMARGQQGDRAIYERLLHQIGSVIEIYVRVRFGDLDILEECVQECLLAIHMARHTYDPRRAFRPWMFTIVRNKVIDILRQRRSRLATVRTLALEPREVLYSEPVLKLIDGIRALERLAPDHREAVALVKYAGYTTAEAAAWLGISEAALKSRLHRGLTAIFRQLEIEGTPA